MIILNEINLKIVTNLPRPKIKSYKHEKSDVFYEICLFSMDFMKSNIYIDSFCVIFVVWFASKKI